jgi:Holliday junction DNA helicase RuvA
MYEYINGILETKKPTEVILDVNGIGYFLKISLSTYKKLPDRGSKIKLKCYLHVREDILQLFGFNDDTERDVFIALLGVSGIGPKLAQTILSGLTPSELVLAIQTGDEKMLNSISGVGKKTAQRLVVELQDKFGKLESSLSKVFLEPKVTFNGVEQEAILALMSLGYNRATAGRAVSKAQNPEKINVVEDLLKKSLQVI